MTRSTLAALAVLAAGLPLHAADDLVEPSEVRRLISNGNHNAFTAMVRWQDAYWLAFRQAASHNSADGDLVVLRSTDGEEWNETLRLDVVQDDRDPQFLATEKRLFLYDPALEGGKLTSYVTYTDDGKNWSKPEAIYKPTYIFWKPAIVGDRFYATAHVKSRDGKSRDVHLITSTDGIHWEQVSKIRGGNWESETTVHFTSPTRVLAFLRQKYGSPQASVLTSEAPFTEWTEKPVPGGHFSGHAAYTFAGQNYFFSRAFDQGRENPQTMIYTFDEQGAMTPYCRLPSGGDCSYPAAVQVGDELLISYYSSHEGSTDIYLARVPLKK